MYLSLITDQFICENEVKGRVFMRARITSICVLFVVASLLGVSAQKVAYMSMFDKTGFGSPEALVWSTYLSWFFFVVMYILIAVSAIKKDTKGSSVKKVIYTLFVILSIPISVWALFVFGMNIRY